MDKTFHRFSELFAPLGLPADEDGIRAFLVTHSPLPVDVVLADAPFWAQAQATLLRQEILENADWTAVVVQLDAALRSAD